ncbi:DUF7537 family lipoprotein [Haloarcula onubensis]|uniref:Lipoprotein n=1 Tax=Haloarcula onubensis TaxID=2950539 RepID=A0ABU2FJG0_9EURY|nr:hypothetical protein [Halomicroarcula sp. S3CR25-11]MDS0280884.1 hypothetical protein [Halomicroarcula sp. S3CR25-11]
MTYPRLATLLVVLTVVLAGCFGGGVTDDGGDTAPDSDDSTATPTAGEPTAADAESGGTGGAMTGTDGLSLSDADTRLRDAGSFTTEWSYTLTTADGTTSTFSDRYEVDLETNRSLERYSSVSGSETGLDYQIFIADGVSYTRYGGSDGEAYYTSTDQAPSVFESATGRASSFYTYLEEDAQFAGRETFDGVSVSRYEYTDREAWQTYNQGVAAGTFDTDEEVTITEFEIATLVDDDGVARLTTWTLAGETESGQAVSAEWRYSLTGVGSTAVEDPGWLDEARAQT